MLDDTPRLSLLLLAPFALLLGACDAGPTGPSGPVPTPDDLALVAGGDQVGEAGLVLDERVRVRALDGGGDPVSGVRVAFEVQGGGGSVVEPVRETGEGGEASTGWRLGTNAAADQRLRVSIVGEDGVPVATVVVTADAISGPAAIVERVDGDGQVVPAGHRFADPLVAAVSDSFGNPVSGARVRWFVDGGGSVVPAVGETDADGHMSVTRYAGAETGIAETEARVEGLDAVLFEATVVAPGELVPASVELFSGDGQTAHVSEAPENPYAVRVLSASGYPVADVEVRWEVVEGGGRVKPERVLTNVDGVGTTTHEYGEQVGPQAVVARTAGLDGDSVVFEGEAVADGPDRIERTAGLGQVDSAGATLPDSLEVRVVDAFGNPVPGVLVTWELEPFSDGALSPTSVRTDADGRARSSWTLGTELGTQKAIARAGELVASFTAIAEEGGADTLEVVAGDDQSGEVGTTLPNDLAVRAVDRHGNPVPGVTIEWAVTSGGGSVDPTSSTTDSAGVAAASWTLGDAEGEQRIRARVVADADGAPVADGPTATLTATANPPSGASQLVRVSGGGQSGVGGQPLDDSFVVRALDAAGLPASGAAVQWAVVGSDGGSVDPLDTVTDGDGEASALATLPEGVGSVLVVEATMDGVGDTVRFTADVVTSGEVASLVRAEGDGQRGPVGEPLPDPYIVQALNGNGDPLANVTVTFEPVDASVDGSVDPDSAVTDSLGFAETVHTLGPTVGTHEVRARAGGQDALFSAEAVGPNGESEFVKISGDGQEGEVGEPLPDPYVVEVRDTSGVGVSGVTVRWWKQQGDGGSISSSETATGPDGRAEITATMPGATDESQTVFATAPALPDTLTFTSTSTNSTAPASLALLAGDGQKGEVRARLPTDLTVVVSDSNGAVVQGAEVEWNLVSRPAGDASGELESARTDTDEEGQADVWFQLGDVPGQYVIEATVGGVQDTVTFVETAYGTPSQILLVSGDGQSAPPGEAFDDPLTVRVEDANGVGVPGVEVEWSATTGDGGGVSEGSGGPFAATTTVTTGSDGRAAVFRQVGSGATSGDPVHTEALLPSFSGVSPVAFQGSAQ